MNWADGPDFGWSIFMTLAATAITIGVREPLWRCAVGLVAAGFGILCVAYMVSYHSTSLEPPGLFVLGFFSIAVFPFAVLFCTVVDIPERGRFDAFHWIGVATLAGVVMHFLVLWGAASYGQQ